jgi:RHS repeat-associated protein
MVTNAAGAVVKRHDYFAFGEDTAAMTGDPRRFTGKELDPETAQHYFGARYYRNLWGRFTSVDPHDIVAEARSQAEFSAFIANPQNWNRYAYVLNRPLTLTDPDGRCWWCALLQRYGPPVANMAKAALQSVFRTAGTPTGQQVISGLAELAAGHQGPSVSPLAAAQRLGLRSIEISQGVVQGVLANGAEVAATFAKVGDSLAVNILAAYNPNKQDALGTLRNLMSGAIDAARAEGVSSLTVRAVAVVNDRLRKLLIQDGWKPLLWQLPDGSWTQAYEKVVNVK